MIVDSHVHLVPPALLGPGWDHPLLPAIRRERGRQVQVSLGGRPVDAIVSELSQPEQILADLAGDGIDGAVVSPWVALLPDGSRSPSADADLCRRHNEAMAATVGQFASQMVGLAALPLADPELAAGVLAEAIHLGLAGAEITPSWGDCYLGHDRFAPLWEAAVDLGATLFVHPATRGLGIAALSQYYLWNAVGNPVETAIAGAELAVAGVLQRFSGLRIVLAHGGGVLPTLAGRLDRAYGVRHEAQARLDEPPSRTIAQMFFDTVTHDHHLLGELVRFVGADHVLLGSDRPFDMGEADPVAAVRSLGLGSTETEQILGGNAARLFGFATHQSQAVASDS